MKTLAAHGGRGGEEMQEYLKKKRTKLQITNAGFIHLYNQGNYHFKSP